MLGGSLSTPCDMLIGQEDRRDLGGVSSHTLRLRLAMCPSFHLDLEKIIVFASAVQIRSGQAVGQMPNRAR